MLPDVQIKPATASDAESVRALLREADLPVDGLEEFFGEGYAIAEAAGTIVGAEGIEVHGQDGLLRSAVIARPWRGKGVGEALTRNRIAWARARRLRALYLLTTTASEYFPRFGFAPADRAIAPDGIRASREFTEACPASATFMFLPLGRED